MARIGLAGLTVMDESVAEVTVTWVDPLTELDVAVIVAGPAATPVTWPLVETAAIVDADVVQLTSAVRFC